MRLSTKIILVTTVSLIVLAATRGTISVSDFLRTMDTHIEEYLELALEQYMDQYPRRLAGLLQLHGLEGVESFVEAYREEAENGAAGMVLGRDA